MPALCIFMGIGVDSSSALDPARNWHRETQHLGLRPPWRGKTAIPLPTVLGHTFLRKALTSRQGWKKLTACSPQNQELQNPTSPQQSRFEPRFYAPRPPPLVHACPRLAIQIQSGQRFLPLRKQGSARNSAARRATKERGRARERQACPAAWLERVFT